MTGDKLAIGSHLTRIDLLKSEPYKLTCVYGGIFYLNRMRIVSPIKSFFVQALVLSALVAGIAAPLYAQDKSAELPQYVIDQYGQPPSIPSGELNDEVQAAVESIFILSLIHI